MTQRSGIIYLPNTNFNIINKDQIFNFSKLLNNKIFFGTDNSQIYEYADNKFDNYKLDIYGYHKIAAVRDGIDFNKKIYFISDNELSLLNDSKIKSLYKGAIKSICKYNNSLYLTSSYETYTYKNDSIKVFFKFPCNALYTSNDNKLIYAKSNEIHEL